MALPTHVTVTAPEGRMTPIHPSDGIDHAGVRMVVEAGTVRRVRWSQTTRRAWNRGDLILCNMDGSRVATPELAAAPRELEGGKIILAAKGAKP
jgi:hypothetical protein